MERVLIKHRDRFSLEIKARYLVPDSADRRIGYKTELYFFLPPSFGISEKTYDPAAFYDQIRPHLRFNTPSFSPSELLSAESARSPLRRVERYLGAAAPGDPQQITFESRLLGAVLKSVLRDFVLETRRSRGDAETDRNAAATLRSCAEVARRYHHIVDSMRKDDRRFGGDVTRHCLLIDEHLSLLLERYVSALLPVLEAKNLCRAEEAASRLLSEEADYRRVAEYPTVPSELSGERDFEEYVYREKMLKKYASEVLYCDVRRRDVARGVEHAMYALAAGMAMAIATAIAFFGQTRFGGLTTSLFVLLVAGYMVKDRAKDIFRDLFRRRLGRRFSDRRSTVRDPEHGKTVATVAERAAFLLEDKMPERLRALRGRGYFEQTVHRFEEESVLQYSRKAVLRARALESLHQRVEGIADIAVIDIEPFLGGLGSSFGLVPSEDRDPRKVERIYHLGVIVRFTCPAGEYARRLRLIVDATGIKRVEETTGHSSADSEAIRYVGRGAATGDPDMDDPDHDL